MVAAVSSQLVVKSVQQKSQVADSASGRRQTSRHGDAKQQPAAVKLNGSTANNINSNANLNSVNRSVCSDSKEGNKGRGGDCGDHGVSTSLVAATYLLPNKCVSA